MVLESEPLNILAERLTETESHLLEFEMLISAFIMTLPDRRRFLRRIEADTQAWARRDTHAAQSDLASRARRRLLDRVQRGLALDGNEK